MKKIEISLLFIGIFLIGIVSAVNVENGECKTFNFPNPEPVNFELVSNSTPLVDFNWTKENKTIELCFSTGQKLGNLKLRWFNSEDSVTKDFTVFEPDTSDSWVSVGSNKLFHINSKPHFLTLDNTSSAHGFAYFTADKNITFLVYENQKKNICLSKKDAFFVQLKDVEATRARVDVDESGIGNCDKLKSAKEVKETPGEIKKTTIIYPNIELKSLDSSRDNDNGLEQLLSFFTIVFMGELLLIIHLLALAYKKKYNKK